MSEPRSKPETQMSRRAFVTKSATLFPAAVIASAGALPTLAAPLSALASHSRDAELLRLVGEFLPLCARYRAAIEEEERLAGIFLDQKPPRPDALRYRFGDFLNVPTERHGAFFWYGLAAVVELRDNPQMRQAVHPADAGVQDSDPAKQARADEIVAAWNAWDAEQTAIRDAIGLTAAEDLAGDIACEVDDQFRVLVALPATTYSGVVAKARAAVAAHLRDWPNAEEASDEPESQQLMLSLVRDLAGLNGAGA